jgi:hypothetical protein
MKIIYPSFHFMLTEFEILPSTVYRTAGSVQKATSIRIGWYMLRKNLIIQNPKNMKYIPSKTIKEEKGCVSVAFKVYRQVPLRSPA